MNKTKILLICYSFPPFPGIGGRRWAKFTKNLVRDNYEIFVVGAEHRIGRPSNWTEDVNKTGINYFPIKTRFFNFFHNHNFNLFSRIAYKFSKFYLQNRYKGNFYDKSLSSADLFYKKAKELIIKNEIKNLIVTIAPYRLVDVGVRLKKEFPELNFIIDSRDPWNIYLDEWDHKYLNKTQKAFELKSELDAVAVANKVFSVCQVVIDFYLEHFPARQKDFIFVPNGYDKEEIVDEIPMEQYSGVKYFVYTGVLYDISIGLFEEFVLQLKEISDKNPLLLHNIEFHFYIPEQDQFKKIANKQNMIKYIKFFDQVPLREIQKVISNSIGGMLFLPPLFEFSLSTKFYEYVSHKKRILVFSNPGDVAKLVEKHQLGYAMLPGNMRLPLEKAIDELSTEQELPPHTFDLTEFETQALTSRIKKHFV